MDERIFNSLDELIRKVLKHNPKANIEKIRRAFAVASDAHSSQTRSSGEPYILHPIAVADILADLELDVDSIVTALLHDTVEDTNIKLPYIAAHFGKQTAELVSGVTKLAKIEYKTEYGHQAENFRKLLLAISKDIRVLLVKLADRVHNMRTINYVKDPKKRAQKAHETMDIYAPLAERMGIHKFKNELQDLSFAVLFPEVRQSILDRMGFLQNKEGSLTAVTEKQIKELLSKSKIKALVEGRAKTPFSIWKKMEHKNITFEQLSDIIGFRIIVKDVGSCYKVLGIIHTKYHALPGEFKDYISTPKTNGYKSLHTVVMGPGQSSIEIQIRTSEMHDIAELGVAAHWTYKQKYNPPFEGGQYRWVRELLEILKNTPNPEEFMDNSKLEMFYDQVFCFSSKGELIALPKESTPIDFAFAMHSNIGLSCVGAKINGKSVPLNTKLQSGDQVDIICSDVAAPSVEWERFVTTGKARSEIRRFNSESLEKIKGKGDLQNFDGVKSSAEIFSEYIIPDEMQFCTACNPILGDKLIGIVFEENLKEVHRTDCSTLDMVDRRRENYSYTSNLSWKHDLDRTYNARIKVTLLNNNSSLAAVNGKIAKFNSHIITMELVSKSLDYYNIVIVLKVKDVTQLVEIISALKTLNDVYKVERV